MKSTAFILGTICVAATVSAAPAVNKTVASTSTPRTASSSSEGSLDTAQVLALAEVTSETKAPFAVDGGAFAFTDTSETSSPISVD